MALRDLLVIDDSLLSLSARTPEQAITEMAARVPAALLPVGADIASQAIARERDMPTNLGLGVAVPHARCPRLERPLVVFGRSTDGVAFGTQSPDLVHLVFMLVTPAEQPNLQVLLLAQVARVAGDPEKRRLLRSATSASEVTEILAAVAPDPRLLTGKGTR